MNASDKSTYIFGTAILTSISFGKSRFTTARTLIILADNYVNQWPKHPLLMVMILGMGDWGSRV